MRAFEGLSVLLRQTSITISQFLLELTHTQQGLSDTAYSVSSIGPYVPAAHPVDESL